MNIAPKLPKHVSSRSFNQDTAKAKRQANEGPVFITTRGKPTHVLLTIEDFERLENKPKRSLLEALAHPESAHIEIDCSEFKSGFSLKPIDFD